MVHAQSLLGLPWQRVKEILRAANIPYKVTLGASFNKFFAVADKGWYVARVDEQADAWHVLLYRPMIYSEFEECTEVAYAETIFTAKKS
ncbi:MAG: hypothetical protein HUJ84_03240 [Veillonella sp.]|nr:hypothetical protein [Veillonella sp.]MCF0155828.1 hypothetical protein [Veillonella sp.]